MKKTKKNAADFSEQTRKSQTQLAEKELKPASTMEIGSITSELKGMIADISEGKVDYKNLLTEALFEKYNIK